MWADLIEIHFRCPTSGTALFAGAQGMLGRRTVLTLCVGGSLVADAIGATPPLLNCLSACTGGSLAGWQGP